MNPPPPVTFLFHRTDLPVARSRYYVLYPVLAALACLLWSAGLSHPLVASEARKVSFDIPAGDAAQALRLYSTQSGQQVLYSNKELAGMRTNRVKGKFTGEEALQRLLLGTSMVATWDQRNGAVAVGRESSDPNG